MQSARNYVWLHPAIGIREKNPVARRRARADVAGVTLSQPPFRQYVHAPHLYPCILLCELSEYFTCLVGGPIVHDDDFELYSALREQVTNCLFNPCLLIPRGDDHRAINRAP